MSWLVQLRDRQERPHLVSSVADHEANSKKSIQFFIQCLQQYYFPNWMGESKRNINPPLTVRLHGSIAFEATMVVYCTELQHKRFQVVVFSQRGYNYPLLIDLEFLCSLQIITDIVWIRDIEKKCFKTDYWLSCFLNNKQLNIPMKEYHSAKNAIK